jgi:hypothetical protein
MDAAAREGGERREQEGAKRSHAGAVGGVFVHRQ